MTDPTLAGIRRGYLLAGRATRFPRKFEAELRGGRVIDLATAAVRAAGLEATIVTTGPLASPPAPLIEDRWSEGPLGALHSVPDVGQRGFFLGGGDMPLLDPSSIRRLTNLHRPGTSIVPRHVDGTLEVLHAIYDLSGPDLDRAWAHGRSLRGLVADLDRRGAVQFPAAEEFPSRTFWDVDVPEDLARVRAVLARGPPAKETTDRSGPGPG